MSDNRKISGTVPFLATSEWNFFRSIYKNIGVYCLVDQEDGQSPMIYIDPNAAEILRINYEDFQNGIRYDKFMNWLMNRTETPPQPQKNVYIYHAGSEQFLIKISQTTTNYGAFGMIQNYSDSLFDSVASAERFKGIDSMTGLMSRDRFIQVISEKITESPKGTLAMIHINGIDNLNHWYGYNHSDRGMIVAARTLARFTNDETFLGIKAMKELMMYFHNKDRAEAFGTLDEICREISAAPITDDFGEIITKGEHLLSASIGYYPFDFLKKDTASDLDPNDPDYEFRVAFADRNKREEEPEEEDDIGTPPDIRRLMDRVSFALAQAREDRTTAIVRFSKEDYDKNHEHYGQVLSFLSLMNDNLFEYHFQPIVEVRTGNIFSFELLMRTAPGVNLTPEEVLEIAASRNQLYDIELRTISNAFELLRKNILELGQARLFVNSIPAYILKPDDFGKLAAEYGDLFDRIIIEFTEQTAVNDANLAVIQQRCQKYNMGLAIDDYGTGYSNVSSLIRYAPNYVKIDRALLTGIQNDPKKQHLTNNIIQFAHKNGIMVLAEGIETKEEMAYVIGLGADLIQGFYTGYPSPSIVNGIDPEKRQEVLEYFEAYKKKEEEGMFTVTHESFLKLSDIDPETFSEVVINRGNLVIDGSGCPGGVPFTIRTMPNSTCHIVMRNIHLKNDGDKVRPAIMVGENSILTLTFEDKNSINTPSGIMVPLDSFLQLDGSGDLTITCDSEHAFGIGNDISHSHGKITIDMEGELNLIINGTDSIGIGGGRSSHNSNISIHNSSVHVLCTGERCIGIGCNADPANVTISNSSVVLDSKASLSCAIGCFDKSAVVDIDDCEISISAEAGHTIGIGVGKNSYCSLLISHSNLNFKMYAQSVICIGSRGSLTNIDMSFSDVSFCCEGQQVTCLGDARSNSGSFLVDQVNMEFNVSSDFCHETGVRGATESHIIGGTKSYQMK